MKQLKKRSHIGKYLLPPDTKKGYKHHRGVISMQMMKSTPTNSSSPYGIFIVQSPGAYHLDGNYTVFGKVIKGMDVVDKINKQKTDNRETPLTNVFMEVSNSKVNILTPDKVETQFGHKIYSQL